MTRERRRQHIAFSITERVSRVPCSHYLREATSNSSTVYRDPLRATSRDGTHLYKQGFWNLITTVASNEGYNFLYDTASWRSLLSNENAAMLASVEPEG